MSSFSLVGRCRDAGVFHIFDSYVKCPFMVLHRLTEIYAVGRIVLGILFYHRAVGFVAAG